MPSQFMTYDEAAALLRGQIGQVQYDEKTGRPLGRITNVWQTADAVYAEVELADGTRVARRLTRASVGPADNHKER